MPPKRNRVPTKPFHPPASESDLDNAGIEDPMEVDTNNDDDFDWVQNVQGRPSPYTYTWSQVYTGLSQTSSGNWIKPCAENRGCNNAPIVMNGKFQELNALGTPHGQLRKPPVCHIVPWSLISVAISNLESTSGKTARPDFKKFACWGDVKNLRAGHNGCNAGGTKATAQNHTSGQMNEATNHVAHCVKEFPIQIGGTWHL